MKLKELVKKLKGFECDALKDKVVVHRFVTNNGYGYKEVVEDVYFDARSGEFVIVTGKEESSNWRNDAELRLEDRK
jgi:hypothetical protein